MAIKNTAPQNSEYKSVYKGQVQNYINVNGNPVYTNTGNLYNSIVMKENSLGKLNKDFITYVSSSQVPYYQRAVLNKELKTYIGKKSKIRDYGSPSNTFEEQEVDYVDNRNYLYYLRAEPLVRQKIGGWNGKKYIVTDGLEEFEWG